MNVCGSVPAYDALSLEDYVRIVLEDKPESSLNDDFLNSIYRKIDEESNHGWIDAKEFNVLTLTDWHVDLAYTVGAVKKNCDNFVCCHKSNGLAEPDKGARKYGELTGCDLPMETVEAQIESLSKLLIGHRKPDVILWTGDSISHDLTGVTQELVYESVQHLTTILK